MSDDTAVKGERLKDRVRVKGKVLIGNRLVESLASSSAEERFDPTPGLNLYRGPQARGASGTASRAGAPVSIVRRQLRKTFEPVAIEDDGLTTCHGIFGNPGMGKTHLLMRMLEKTLSLEAKEEKRFGALILDPKGTLMDEVRTAANRAGRAGDVRLVTTAELLHSCLPEEHRAAAVLPADTLPPLDLTSGRPTPGVREVGMNILDADLPPSEMALALVLAAQSAVKSASDPYWTNAWINLFMGAAELMRVTGRVLTVANLVGETVGTSRSGRPRLDLLVAEAKRAARSSPHARDIQNAIDRVEMHQNQKGENAATINVLVATALSEFQRSRYRDAYSSEQPRPAYTNLYDQIVQDGLIVVLSFTKLEEGFARMVVTLFKTLFQRRFLCRYERYRSDPANVNFERPVLLMCDEYQEVATELAGRPVGDASFFQHARQSGCLGLLATQSVSGMIQNLPGDAPEAALDAIISTFASTIFFQSSDPATRRLAISLAGETEAYVASSSASYGAEGVSHSRSRQLETRSLIQESQLANLRRGQALVVGSLNNAADEPDDPGDPPPKGRIVEFVAVPKEADANAPGRDADREVHQ
jgi:TraM recognition site of TraD and TraG